MTNLSDEGRMLREPIFTARWLGHFIEQSESSFPFLVSTVNGQWQKPPRLKLDSPNLKSIHLGVDVGMMIKNLSKEDYTIFATLRLLLAKTAQATQQVIWSKTCIFLQSTLLNYYNHNNHKQSSMYHVHRMYFCNLWPQQP